MYLELRKPKVNTWKLCCNIGRSKLNKKVIPATETTVLMLLSCRQFE